MESLKGHILALEVTMSRMAAAIAQITEQDSAWLHSELEAVKEQLSKVSANVSSETGLRLKEGGFTAAENIFEVAIATLDKKGTARFTLP